MKKLLDAYQHPSNDSRPMPLWVWNEAITPERIHSTLEEFVAAGFGGVFIHPRPGLLTEYLSEEWFHLWKIALDHCTRLGLDCHVYDENCYPSGFAGGHVPARHPETILSGLRIESTRATEIRNSFVLGDSAGVFQLEDGKWVRMTQSFTRKPKNDAPIPTVNNFDSTTQESEAQRNDSEVPTLIARWSTVPCRVWTGGLPYVDLTLAETTRAFLASTHDQYALRFPDRLGKNLKYFFTDEPTIMASGMLPLHPQFLVEFENEHHYAFLDRLADFLSNSEEGMTVRYDYYTTKNRLFTTHFAKAIHDWCEKRSCAFTGHFDEHEWPNPHSSPNSMAAQRWMQAPGIDLLGFQYDSNQMELNSLYLMNLREVTSVAAQCGRERILCEAYGGGGYNTSLEYFKSLSSFLLVNGINFINPHLSFDSLSGSRKYDWAQTLSPQSSWWKSYRKIADHDARSCAVLRLTTPLNRVLLLHPTLSAWMHSMPAAIATECRFQAAETCYKKLRAEQIKIVQLLTNRQIDFDLGDEIIISEMGSANRKTLRVGRCAYEAVILPPTMETALESTLQLIEEFVRQGGCVYTLQGAVPQRIQGRPSPAFENLQKQFAGQFLDFPSWASLIEQIAKEIPPRIAQADGNPLPAGISHACRFTEDHQPVHVFANPGADPLSFSLNLPENAAILLNPLHDSQRIYHPSREKLVLEPRDFVILLPSEEKIQPVPQSTPSIEVQLQQSSISATRPNVLVLETCDLSAGTKNLPGLGVAEANRSLWQQHGFHETPWIWRIQFRDTLAMHSFAQDSGFSALYPFEIDPSGISAAQTSLRLAAENPGHYSITVNGTPIEFGQAETWMDPTIRSAFIGDKVHAGNNQIEISAKPFHIHCELAPFYLLGEFFLQSTAAGFSIAAPRLLQKGDWNLQGMPFYPWQANYHYNFKLQQPVGRIRIALPEWKGSSSRILINDTLIGIIPYPPLEIDHPVQLAAGDHRLTVEISGPMKNLMGPFFNNGLPILWSWLNRPKGYPPGEQYISTPAGLQEPPRLFIQ